LERSNTASVSHFTPAAVMALWLQQIVQCHIAERNILPYTAHTAHAPACIRS
jgi:hypothetical protein